MRDSELIPSVAKKIANGAIIGWFNGRMEFGPRALGARSILGDARSNIMQKKMNLKIKYRESFRPFAPSVLDDKVGEWFDFKGESPYMLMVANVKKKYQRKMNVRESKLFGIDKLNVIRSKKVPAITHVDYSARLQTVHKKNKSQISSVIRRIL